ncbi:unnamed protein product [Rangifer tarandus platyrhynchus]|uniref:FAD dependent oxidoreductase domain-containing protein n=1 Tax=Rangifer tarandus platyrhynchus TaxID=3082113 RepID=A0ABN8YP93_RANTA|nr:unnamed protein product [Rangifer tarandus platyrhynchus]
MEFLFQSYTRTGSIFLAQTQDRLISLKRISSRLNVIGIPCEIVSPRRVAELHPLLNVHDLVGAMHVPEDAVVSSADVALALASAASQNVMLFKAHLTSHSRMPGSSGPYSVRPPDPPPEKPVSRSGSNC